MTQFIASSPSSELNQCIDTTQWVQREHQHANAYLNQEQQENSMPSQGIYFLVGKVRRVHLKKQLGKVHPCAWAIMFYKY